LGGIYGLEGNKKILEAESKINLEIKIEYNLYRATLNFKL
jgi:hypothetical protein